MPSIAFDTPPYSNKLQKVGFTGEQAEAMAQANVEALKEMMTAQQLATKQDLEKVRVSPGHCIASVKHETLKWAMSM